MAPKCFQTTTNSAFPRWTAATPWQKAGVMGRKGKKKSPLTSNAHQASRDQQRMLRICYDSRTCCFSIIQRKFSSKKLLSYGWMSRGRSCRHVIIMSTTFWARAVRVWKLQRRATVPERLTSRVKTLSSAKPCVFSGQVACGVTGVGSLFPRRVRASMWESRGQKKAQRTVAELDLHFKMLKRGQPWSTFGRSGRQNVHEDCSESSICCKIRKNWHVQSSATSSPLSALREHWSTWCDAPAMWVCSRLWQNALARLRAAKHQWCCRAPGSWQAGLQLELAKRIVIAARREELDCRSYKRGNWEAAQSRSGPHKWLFSWEKRCLSKEVAQWRSSSTKKSIACPSSHSIIHPSIHPSIPSFIGSWIHGFTESLVHCFIGSLIRCRLIDSLVHSCIDSLIHWFPESPNHWFVDSLNHRFIDSSVHCFTESLRIHWFIYWLLSHSLVHGLIDSLAHRLIKSLMHWLIDSLFHWITDWVLHWITESSIHWAVDSLIHWFINSLVHWLDDSLGHCFASSLIHWFDRYWFAGSSIHRFVDSFI